MVIGSGMMAKAFGDFLNNDSVIVFASGVSNSRETDPAAFEKEFTMISQLKGTSAALIYFSSCGIFDPSLASSLYVKHKLKIEKYIKENFNNYWIFRLPNVIGKSNNGHTMTNFFHNAIQNAHPFELHKNAHRYFIDVDDVELIIKKVIDEKNLASGSYNLLYPYACNVQQLVNMLEEVLNKKATYTLNETMGELYHVTISKELLPYTTFNVAESEQYIKRIIAKYYTNPVHS